MAYAPYNFKIEEDNVCLYSYTDKYYISVGIMGIHFNHQELNALKSVLKMLDEISKEMEESV